MKKLLFIFALCGLITACGGSDGGSNPSDPSGPIAGTPGEDTTVGGGENPGEDSTPEDEDSDLIEGVDPNAEFYQAAIGLGYTDQQIKSTCELEDVTCYMVENSDGKAEAVVTVSEKKEKTDHRGIYHVSESNIHLFLNQYVIRFENSVTYDATKTQYEINKVDPKPFNGVTFIMEPISDIDIDSITARSFSFPYKYKEIIGYKLTNDDFNAFDGDRIVNDFKYSINWLDSVYAIHSDSEISEEISESFFDSRKMPQEFKEFAKAMIFMNWS